MGGFFTNLNFSLDIEKQVQDICKYFKNGIFLRK